MLDEVRDALARVKLVPVEAQAITLGRSCYLVNTEVWDGALPELAKYATGEEEPDPAFLLHSILDSLPRMPGGSKDWCEIQEGDAIWVIPVREPIQGDYHLSDEKVRHRRSDLVGALPHWGAWQPPDS